MGLTSHDWITKRQTVLAVSEVNFDPSESVIPILNQKMKKHSESSTGKDMCQTNSKRHCKLQRHFRMLLMELWALLGYAWRDVWTVYTGIYAWHWSWSREPCHWLARFPNQSLQNIQSQPVIRAFLNYHIAFPPSQELQEAFEFIGHPSCQPSANKTKRHILIKFQNNSFHVTTLLHH